MSIVWKLRSEEHSRSQRGVRPYVSVGLGFGVLAHTARSERTKQRLPVKEETFQPQRRVLLCSCTALEAGLGFTAF